MRKCIVLVFTSMACERQYTPQTPAATASGLYLNNFAPQNRLMNVKPRAW